jgi:pimeloyl-ACP methyl ester carboxylesterase
LTDSVVLVHGVLMPGVELGLLARRLRRCGFRPLIFRYPSRRHGLRHHAAALARFLASVPAGRVHCVGHSMGGLVILAALRQRDLPPGRVVLLGSPTRGSRVARRLARSAAGRWLLGRSTEGALLEPVPAPGGGREIGIIAGDLPYGLGTAIAGLGGRHDGTVAVEETVLPGASDRIVLRATHTGLVLSHAVARQVCAFLQDGRFHPASRSAAHGRL